MPHTVTQTMTQTEIQAEARRAGSMRHSRTLRSSMNSLSNNNYRSVRDNQLQGAPRNDLLLSNRFENLIVQDNQAGEIPTINSTGAQAPGELCEATASVHQPSKRRKKTTAKRPRMQNSSSVTSGLVTVKSQVRTRSMTRREDDASRRDSAEPPALRQKRLHQPRSVLTRSMRRSQSCQSQFFDDSIPNNVETLSHLRGNNSSLDRSSAASPCHSDTDPDTRAPGLSTGDISRPSEREL